MVDALVLEASTSVCGFESHLPHQKKRAPKGAFFFWCQGIWHSQMPPAASGTSASLYVWQEPAIPPHTPLPFCDTIQFAIETDRSYHRQGPGAELRSGLFLCPKFAPPPAKSKLTALPTGFPKTALPESVPQSGTPKLFTLPYSLAPLRPSRPASRERQRTALRMGGGSVPWQQCGTAKRPFPRTAPHAGHRLVLNPCRRAALRNSSLFSIHSSSPAPFSLRSGQQNKNIFCFLVT